MKKPISAASAITDARTESLLQDLNLSPYAVLEYIDQLLGSSDADELALPRADAHLIRRAIAKHWFVNGQPLTRFWWGWNISGEPVKETDEQE